MPQHQHPPHLSTLSWGVFIVLLAAAVLIAAGYPLGPITVLGGIAVVMFAYAYPYVAFGLLIALVPFLGLTVNIPAGSLPFGERLFQGSIDVLAGEVVAIAVLISWGLKIIRLWIKRNDVNWKPWLPLLYPMLAIVATHLLSAFSVFRPDALLVIKYTIRPVLWSYLIYVALTVNYVRSRRKLKMVLGIIIVTGIFAALMGFASLFFSQDPGQLVPRAKPLPMFGANPLGENHNLLAEWLSVTVLCSIAMIALSSSARLKRMLVAAAAFQALIALLTFARSLWIVFAFEAFLLSFLVWREQLKRFAHLVTIGLLLLLPLVVIMISFSASKFVAGSTSTRLMLTEIALNVWSQSPWIGAGAGTYVDRVGSTALFVIEYGNPLDSHGWAQKLLAEVGIIGSLAVLWLVWAAYTYTRDQLAKWYARPSPERTVILVLAISAAGALLYQLFNTNYWTGKLWLPLGLLLAATRALRKEQRSDERLVDSV